MLAQCLEHWLYVALVCLIIIHDSLVLAELFEVPTLDQTYCLSIDTTDSAPRIFHIKVILWLVFNEHSLALYSLNYANQIRLLVIDCIYIHSVIILSFLLFVKQTTELGK